jgi:hypothetical protein
MSSSFRIPRGLAVAAVAVGGLLAVSATAAPASAAPIQPGLTPDAGAPVVDQVQYWGHPGWGPPPPRYGWGGPGWHHGWGRPGWRHGWYGPRCRVNYIRRWDRWNGGWVVRPVRQCW